MTIDIAKASKQEIAAVIEDVLKPLMTAARHAGVTAGKWDIYTIEIAVKNVDMLGIVRIYAVVKWPIIMAATSSMKKTGPEINLADPDSYPLVRKSPRTN